MRRILIGFAAMTFLCAAPVFANAGGDKDAPKTTKASGPSATASDKTTAKAPAAKPEVVAPATELQKLQDLIQAQQQELVAQRKALDEQQKEIDALKGRSAVAPVQPQSDSDPSPAAALAAAPKPAAAMPAPVATPLTATESGSTNRATAAAPKQVQAGEPKLGPLALDKIKLGVTFFGDYAFYNETGFGPQFNTQINQTGPGNDHFNSFDITRAYLNFFYTPNDKVTLRITPNVYRQVDGSATAIGNGNGSQIGGSANGNLVFRLKYAYIEFNKPFAGSAAFGKAKITIGSETNPLVDWEEGLYGYRFTSLVPWNYLSLSSTFVGAKIHGPIEFNGKEYLDYDIGVFNTATFHAIEQNDKKDAMGRLTWYPMGTTSDRTGFGITVFENYGYNTKTPDSRSTPLNRLATIVSYQTHSKSAQVAFEYDLGRNSFGTGNLFSGAIPAPGGIFDAGGTAKDIGTIASAVLAGDQTRQQGMDVFGHVKLGRSPFALFGLYEYFQPNTKYDFRSAGFTADPIDFARTLGGISYHYNDHLDFAVEDSNYRWLHPQGTLGTQDTNGIFLNFQFNY